MSYNEDLSFTYFGPTKIIFAAGASRDVEIEMNNLGGTKALLVTDEGIIKAGLIDEIKNILKDKCIGIFSDIPQDTGVDVVNACAEFGRVRGADIVISVGGGSVIDTAKAVCILLTEGGNLEDFEGVSMLNRLQTPHIVIPTTAGTGCEVTWAAVIMDKKRGQKRLVSEPFNAPRIGILDPKMTQKLPKLLTASTGMDAMTHAVESLCGILHQPIADGLAMQAIRLLYRYLPTCVNNGDDLTARGHVQIAATLAGWAFANSMVSIVHAMAHSIGAVAHVPHGIANGILLPHCMEFNLDDATEAYAMVAEAMGVREKGMDDPTAAKAAISAMKDFTKKISHPQKLSAVGVKEEQIIKAADLSLSDGTILWNPKPVSSSTETLDIFRKAF